MLNYLKHKWRFLLVVLMLCVFNIYVWDGACKKQQINKKQYLVLRGKMKWQKSHFGTLSYLII